MKLLCFLNRGKRRVWLAQAAETIRKMKIYFNFSRLIAIYRLVVEGRELKGGGGMKISIVDDQAARSLTRLLSTKLLQCSNQSGETSRAERLVNAPTRADSQLKARGIILSNQNEKYIYKKIKHCFAILLCAWRVRVCVLRHEKAELSSKPKNKTLKRSCFISGELSSVRDHIGKV